MTDSSMVLAQRASEMAAVATARVNSHELECSRRYGEVRDRFTGLEEKLDEMREAADKRFRAQMTAFVTLLATAGANVFGPVVLKWLHLL